LYFEYAYTRGVRTASTKYIERADPYPSELTDSNTDQPVNRPVERENLARDLAKFFRRIGAPPIAGWRRTTKQELHEYPAVQ
jgi:hypothetical protein